jgi:CO/xanthine dehydrogenase Mo-binding subunit
MSSRARQVDPELEPFQEERWRLLALPLDRRDFLRFFGGGLLVCLAHPPAIAQESGRAGGGESVPHNIAAWLHIDADSKVRVFTGKVEVGQNIRTSLAQLVAEELHVPFASITMVMGDTALVPYDAGTFGSQSTPRMGPQLRTMAAAARQAMVEAAAKRWQLDATQLTAEAGKVTDPHTARSFTYGELTGGQDLIQVVSSSEWKTPAAEWKIAGTAVPKADGRDFVTGRHQYPSDIVREGMLFGAILRPTGYNATLVSLDSSAAEKIPGVKVIHDGDFVGVVAPDGFTAQRAVSALRAEWKVPAQSSNRELFKLLKDTADAGDGPQSVSGSVEQALAAAPIRVDQQYTVQFIAHTPLEPRAAVAEWNGNGVTVWTGTQRPFGVRDELVDAFHLAADKVRVIQPDMGSGYGGKHTGEMAVEAARLARAAGKSIKLVWTREEEFTWAYFRPAGVIDIRAAAQSDGKLTAWECHNYNSGSAGIDTPYVVPAKLAHYHPSQSPLRQGSYRSIGAAANFFAREAHMDLVAHAAGLDPLEFRLKNLADARVRAVFQAAAETFGWGREKSTSTRGFGIAGGTEKGGYTAACVEVAIDATARTVRVVRVVQAWESGAIVNPDGLRNQTVGAIVQGIGGALFEQILFADGRVLNPHFAQYRVPRFSDVPQIEVVLLDRKDLPSAGAGEIGIVALAPAVANALFAATGVPVPALPMAPRTPAPGAAAPPLYS